LTVNLLQQITVALKKLDKTKIPTLTSVQHMV
jgi:hypothetical protein